MNLFLIILAALIGGCALICVGLALWLLIDLFLERYREDGDDK